MPQGCKAKPQQEVVQASERCDSYGSSRGGSCYLCVSHPVASNSLRPQGLQPTRLLCPWNYPGKNTGVGCHFLLQGSSRPRDRTRFPSASCSGRQVLHHLSHQEVKGAPHIRVVLATQRREQYCQIFQFVMQDGSPLIFPAALQTERRRPPASLPGSRIAGRGGVRSLPSSAEGTLWSEGRQPAGAQGRHSPSLETQGRRGGGWEGERGGRRRGPAFHRLGHLLTALRREGGSRPARRQLCPPEEPGVRAMDWEPRFAALSCSRVCLCWPGLTGLIRSGTRSPQLAFSLPRAFHARFAI